MPFARPRRRLGRERVLEVQDVAVSFGAVKALDGVGLVVREGEFVGLIGPNGAGKTTCFNVICGFVAPLRGRVRLDGRRINAWSTARRARAGITRTFQNIGLDKKASVWDNVCVAREGGPLFGAPAAAESDVRARDLLERLELTGVLNETIEGLSIGTAKLVELACALVRRPRVLLLDEPSSGLGPPERARLADLLRELHATTSLSVLMIEHDMQLAMSTVDYVYALDFGVPLAEGTPAQVGADERVIEAYLGAPA